MKRNRRNNARKERIIMIASSAFVLSALTMTGIYMKSNNAEEQDDGYMLDFTAMEDSVEDKAREIAQNNQGESQAADNGAGNGMLQGLGNLDDDLDYLPMEAGSGQVTIPGLTGGLLEDTPAGEGILSGEDMSGTEDATEAGASGVAGNPTGGDAGLEARDKAAGESSQPAGDAGAGETVPPEEEPADDSSQEESAEDTAGSDVVVETMHFAESEGLLRPVGGEVLIPFSMDSSVYFSTLDQFKYNPAVMIAAEVGSPVAACAEGIVVDIFQDEEIGHAITMDLGDGYQITYGQLYDINVAVGAQVQPGENIASIASPTKYFSVEGSNLYLKLTAGGMPVNPEALFR